MSQADSVGGSGAAAPRVPEPIVGSIDKQDIVEAFAAGLRDFQAAPLYGLAFGGIYAIAGIPVALILYRWSRKHGVRYPCRIHLEPWATNDLLRSSYGTFRLSAALHFPCSHTSDPSTISPMQGVAWRRAMTRSAIVTFM